MKELSIEEKARRYNKAIEIAKEINDEQRAQPHNVMIRVFPELAESKDEKIRKYIIKVVHEWWVRCNDPAPDFPNEEQMLAWLEKQAEQKSWSEKDETNLRQTEYAVMKFFGGDCLLVGWLRKSLKERYTWKPSDEQMRVLDLAIRCGINRGTTEETTLVSLFNDLKKLKE